MANKPHDRTQDGKVPAGQGAAADDGRSRPEVGPEGEITETRHRRTESWSPVKADTRKHDEEDEREPPQDPSDEPLVEDEP